MKYGLTDHQLHLILDCIRKFPEIQKVILFGSRAIGNFKPGSDIDLMVVGESVSAQTITRLFGCLNDEISVPFRFDLVAENTTSDLMDHVRQHGVIFFEK